MKKYIAIIMLLVISSVSQAQITMPKIDTNSLTSEALKNFVKPPAIGDIGSTTKSVVDMLGSKLSLPASMKPGLMDAVGGFLTSKKPIAGLAGTNPADYLAKFNPLQKGLFGKLKGIMGADAVTKLLGLKPTGSNIAGDVLSHLFY